MMPPRRFAILAFIVLATLPPLSAAAAKPLPDPIPLNIRLPISNKKTTLWEGGIRVPCLMRWPARLPKGKVTNQVGITMDLSATFAAIAGAKPAADRPFDGINLLPILTGEQPVQSRTLFWRVNNAIRRQKAVRHGNWKYVQDSNVDLLFDVVADPGERVDLSFRRPDVVAEAKRHLAAWEADLAKERPDILVK